MKGAMKDKVALVIPDDTGSCNMEGQEKHKQNGVGLDY